MPAFNRKIDLEICREHRHDISPDRTSPINAMSARLFMVPWAPISGTFRSWASYLKICGDRTLYNLGLFTASQLWVSFCWLIPYFLYSVWPAQKAWRLGKYRGTIHVLFQYMSDEYHDQTMGMGFLCVFSDVLVFRNNLEDVNGNLFCFAFWMFISSFYIDSLTNRRFILLLHPTRLEIYKDMKPS